MGAAPYDINGAVHLPCTTPRSITMIPWTSTIETLLATADNQDTPEWVKPPITKAMAPLTPEEINTILTDAALITTTMEIGMEDNNMDTIMDGDDSPTGAPLSNTIQQVWGYMLQAIAFAKGVVTSLTNRGVPKYLMVVLLLLTTNWLGNIIYNGMPAPLGGIPTAIGAAYLCPLVLRANREKLVEAMREYLG